MIKSTDSLIALTARFLRERKLMNRFYANMRTNATSKNSASRKYWKETNGNIRDYLGLRIIKTDVSITPLYVSMLWDETNEGYDFWYDANKECKSFIESFIKCKLEY